MLKRKQRLQDCKVLLHGPLTVQLLTSLRYIGSLYEGPSLSQSHEEGRADCLFCLSVWFIFTPLVCRIIQLIFTLRISVFDSLQLIHSIGNSFQRSSHLLGVMTRTHVLDIHRERRERERDGVVGRGDYHRIILVSTYHKSGPSGLYLRGVPVPCLNGTTSLRPVHTDRYRYRSVNRTNHRHPKS